MQEIATIAAISTAHGQGAVALIRLSGPDCLKILSKCWKGRPATQLPPRTACLGKITKLDGTTLDEVIALSYPAPHSYTGEDSLEIMCHGGILVTKRVLERLYSCGATPAEPGEFTKRAFLNARMDLTQAEAVMDILSAQTDLALRAAQDQLKGSLGEKIKTQTEAVIGLLAHIEAYIDFPDEDISPDTSAALSNKTEETRKELCKLLQTADQGRLLREGVRTVLIGAPNVGKSSLLNLLLGYERAIVSSIPGTTRDTLEETINIAGYPLRLIDTAGVRDSDDIIEQAGIQRTEQALAEADLILQVIDTTRSKAENINVPVTASNGTHAHILRLLNKTDLPAHTDWANEITQIKNKLDETITENNSVTTILLSCANGSGLDNLTQAISRNLNSNDWVDQRSTMIAINTRHRHCLFQAEQALAATREGILHNQNPEFIALDLRDALLHLGEITGRVDTEDILGKIFSTFCIGK